MKIAAMRGENGYCAHVRGPVRESYMTVSSPNDMSNMNTLELVVRGDVFKMSGTGLPRIDVGEEVMVHFDTPHHYPIVVGLQVIKDDQAIFRMQISSKNIYRFVE